MLTTLLLLVYIGLPMSLLTLSFNAYNLLL